MWARLLACLSLRRRKCFVSVMGLSRCVAACFLVIFLAKTSQCLPAYFKDCGSKQSVIEEAEVSGCSETDQECQLKKGTNVNVTITFKTKEVITSATAVVHGRIKGVSIPFPIPQSDGCKSGLNCPVKSDSTAVYRSTIPVRKLFPDLRVIVVWELKDAKTNDIFCAAFNAEIVD